jgi:hypothetical protein
MELRTAVFVLGGPISGIIRSLWRSDLAAAPWAMFAGGNHRVSLNEGNFTGIDPDAQPSPQ